MRTGEKEQEYATWLLKLGDGKHIKEPGLPYEYMSLPEDLLSKDIVTDIFGTNFDEKDESLYQRAILCPKNQDCDVINQRVLDLIKNKKEHTFKSVDTIRSNDPQDRVNYPIEFLHSITPSGFPPHELKVKKGAIVMLLRNMNTQEGLSNGSRMIVMDVFNNCLKCKIITGTHSGKIHLIPRFVLTSKTGELPFELRRRQFPIKLAFSITINKAQGQTVPKVGIFLPKPVFSHGQMYVAFSRSTARQNVKIEVSQTGEQGRFSDKVGTFTKNIVYHEVL